jgi:hypothetical protein
MKIHINYHTRKGYNLGRFDIYHITEKSTVIDIWRLSIYFVKG